MGKARDLARVIVNSSGAIDASNLGNAVPADGSITTAKLANDAVTAAKIAAQAVGREEVGYSGAILQVVTVTKTNSFSHGGTSWVDIPDLSATITPVRSTSKLLHLITLNGRTNGIGGFALTDGSNNQIAPFGAKFQPSYYEAHGNINYFNGDDNLQTQNTLMFMETSAVGTTSPITRKLRVRNEGTSNTMGINRPVGSNNQPYNSAISTLTILEVAG